MRSKNYDKWSATKCITMKKIHNLSNTLDREIEELSTSFDTNKFFRVVRDKELLSTIRKGGYINDDILNKMFKEYNINE